VYVSCDTDIFPIGVNAAAFENGDIALCLYFDYLRSVEERDTLWRFVPATSVLTAACSAFGMDVKSLSRKPTPTEKGLAGAHAYTYIYIFFPTPGTYPQREATWD
jgi:hypothetical protein